MKPRDERRIREIVGAIRERARRLVLSRRPRYVDTRLGGFCAVVADRVTRELVQAGYHATFVVGVVDPEIGAHCWTELPDLGVLVDATATQFANYGLFLPRVMVMPVNRAYREVVPGRPWLYLPCHHGARAAVEIHQWPAQQRPATWRNERLWADAG